MRELRIVRLLGLAILLSAAALTGCKKHVAAAPTTQTPTPPPQPAAAAPTITLRADNSTINRGQATTLRWDTKNATSVRIEPGLGDVSMTGTRSINPTSSVTYMATAIGPGGTTSDSARITVNIPPAPAPAPPRTPNVSMDQLFQQNVKSIYFDYDKSNIRADQTSTLQSNAAWLKQHPEVRFTIEGHCDERGSEEYNLALGDRRANAVKQFLVDQGVPESRISTISYGEDRPVCHEGTEDCYQRNRFAGFVPKPASE